MLSVILYTCVTILIREERTLDLFMRICKVKLPCFNYNFTKNKCIPIVMYTYIYFFFVIIPINQYISIKKIKYLLIVNIMC